MDPNANLTEQLRLAHGLIDIWDEGAKVEREFTPEERRQMELDAMCLAELVLALDDWRTKGGFLPTRWQPKNPQPTESTP